MAYRTVGGDATVEQTAAPAPHSLRRLSDWTSKRVDSGVIRSPVSLHINGFLRAGVDASGVEGGVCETAVRQERCAFVRRTALLSGGGGI